MSRVYKIGAFVSLICALAAGGVARGSTDGGDTVLVLSHPKGRVRVATLELFRRIEDVVRSSGKFTLVHPEALRRIIADRGGRSDFGPIPVVYQSSFHKSHPQASSVRATKEKDGASRPIHALQAALDTEAVKGALIVDCLETTGGMVRSCGVYYYDRAQGRVTASNRKHFKVGIASADKWAGSLVVGLSEGIRISTERREKARIQAVLEKSVDDDAPSQAWLEMRGSGQSVSVPGGTISSVPGAGLTLGVVRDSFVIGLAAEMFRADVSQEGERQFYLERDGGLAFGVQARALDALIWDLTLEAAYAVREMTHNVEFAGTAAVRDDGQSGTGDRLLSRDIRLSAAPGMLWKIGDVWSFGTSVRLSRYLPLSLKGDGHYADGTFNSHSVGLGIRVGASF